MPPPGNNAAYLPFSPQVGHVYVLSCDLNPPSGGSGNWEALGYAIGHDTLNRLLTTMEPGCWPATAAAIRCLMAP